VSSIYETELSHVGTADVITNSSVHSRERLVDKLEQATKTRPSLVAIDLPALADYWFTTCEGSFLLAQGPCPAEWWRLRVTV